MFVSIEACCDYIASNLDVDNCIGIRNFARHYFCSALERSAQRFLLEHFTEVRKPQLIRRLNILYSHCCCFSCSSYSPSYLPPFPSVSHIRPILFVCIDTCTEL